MVKYANLICKCIAYYIYAYQLRCPKQDVLRTLRKIFYTFATEAGIHPCMHSSKSASMLLGARDLA